MKPGQTIPQSLSGEYSGASAGGEYPRDSSFDDVQRRLEKSTLCDGAWCSHGPAIRLGLVLVAGLVLVTIFFWQILVTMPHVIFVDGDTGSYLNKEPQRTVALYYFIKSVLLLRKDFYAVAIAQGVLLGLFAALLAYAVARVTRSAVLGFAPLLVCLFNVALLERSRVLSTDGLFPIACIGLMAFALLLYEKVSPWRIGCFLLVGFFACFIRSIAEPLLWSLLLVLILRLWPEHRRVAGVLVAGAFAIHALITGINYLNYRIWVPQAQAGMVLIIGAAFIADEQAPPGSGDAYPRGFVAATAPMRAEYKKAMGWAEKYKVVDTYIGMQIWKLGWDTLVRGGRYDFDRSRYDKFKHYGGNVATIIMANDVFEQAALTIMRHNPGEYANLVLINLIAGTHMFTSYDDHPLEWRYKPAQSDQVTRLKAYGGVGDPELVSRVIGDPELASLMVKAAEDWQNVSLEPKADIAKPLRAFFGLGGILTTEITRSPLRNAATEGGTLNWLFVIESAVVIVLASGRLLCRRPIDNRLGVLLLFILPTWGYLFALCLLIPPAGVYMNATSSFVYIALLIGVWTVFATAAKMFWFTAVRKPWINAPVARGSIAQAE
jgi:hypothetical protein